MPAWAYRVSADISSPVGEGLEDEAAGVPQAALDLAEIGVRDAAHVGELADRQVAELALPADELAEAGVGIGALDGHCRFPA